MVKLLADPVVKTEGLLEAHEVDTLSEAQDWAWDSLDRMSREARKDNSNIEQAVAKGLRRYFRDMLGKKAANFGTCHPRVVVSIVAQRTTGVDDATGYRRFDLCDYLVGYPFYGLAHRPAWRRY